MKKGFTLIELLAVILILGIISLIAIPTITKILEESRYGAFKSTISNISKKVEESCTESKIKNEEPNNTYIISNNKISPKLDIKGNLPNGIINIDKDCNVTYKISNENFSAIKENANDENTFISKKQDMSEIYLEPNLEIGTPVYINPEENKICKESEANSETGVKTGCMKWYVYKINNNNTYQLILDHNTTASVPWNSTDNNTNGMLEVKDALLEDTKTWKSVLNPDIISADDIADITKASRSDTLAWNSSKKIGSVSIENIFWYYLDGYQNSNKTVYAEEQNGWQKQVANSTNISKFKWLFDNTYNCKIYGCSIENNNLYNIYKKSTTTNLNGYWTKTKTSDPKYVWLILYDGCLEFNNCSRTSFGIRPIITF